MYTVLFLNERDKLWLNRHDFLVLYFKLENISTLDFKFLQEKCLRQVLFAGTYFCRSLEKLQLKSQNLQPAKISCYTVYNNVNLCFKRFGLSFVSRLTLWYWSRRFDRTLQVFIRRYCRSTESDYLYHPGC